MKVYSLINQKGGVAKTTSTYNISRKLAEKGNRVLMVDMDPQASLTISTGIEPEELEKTIADVMISFNGRKKENISNTIIQIEENLHLVPSIIDLTAADNLLHNEMSRESILKRALKSVREYYDYCLIDCPPALNQLSINALVAADFCIIPVACEYLAFRGLEMLNDTISQVQESLNPDLKVLGVLATFHNRTIHARENLEKLKEGYNVIGVIGTTVKARDSVYSGKPIVVYDPKSKVAQEYSEITERIVVNE
jgi:chromosome partitioning protein